MMSQAKYIRGICLEEIKRKLDKPSQAIGFDYFVQLSSRYIIANESGRATVCNWAVRKNCRIF